MGLAGDGEGANDGEEEVDREDGRGVRDVDVFFCDGDVGG